MNIMIKNSNVERIHYDMIIINIMCFVYLNKLIRLRNVSFRDLTAET